jgi:sulfatase modifying factor 1
MVCVRGGYFVRGSDAPDTCVQTGDPSAPELVPTPAARVWVDTFYIDANEVTNAAYRTCVTAGACADVRPLYRDFHRDDQPHTGGSWFDAMAFCAARGMTLPTEAQYEAAIGGPAGERTPFGDGPLTCEQAVIMDESGRSCGVLQRGREPDKGRVLEVGSRPPGRYGIYDLVGNAEEWALDWWTPSWAACGEECGQINPRGPCDGALECPGHRTRAVRGGSWYWPAECATRSHRRRYPPSNEPTHHFGFRCATGLP